MLNPDEISISRSRRRPLHAYADHAHYWITAATLEHEPRFRNDARKSHFVTELHAAARTWSVELVAWTLMEHHYHAIVIPQEGRALSRFLGRLHGTTARHVNLLDERLGDQVWRQYWDVFLRTEGDYWSRLNYIWWNPVRHGFCSRPEEWPWTNLHEMMADPDEQVTTKLTAFPAPRKLPGDI
ncbi:MAG: REP-associated tyrosine transposase [Actinomycetota bacterium]